jgi:transposase
MRKLGPLGRLKVVATVGPHIVCGHSSIGTGTFGERKKVGCAKLDRLRMPWANALGGGGIHEKLRTEWKPAFLAVTNALSNAERLTRANEHQLCGRRGPSAHGELDGASQSQHWKQRRRATGLLLEAQPRRPRRRPGRAGQAQEGPQRKRTRLAAEVNRREHEDEEKFKHSKRNRMERRANHTNSSARGQKRAHATPASCLTGTVRVPIV